MIDLLCNFSFVLVLKMNSIFECSFQNFHVKFLAKFCNSESFLVIERSLRNAMWQDCLDKNFVFLVFWIKIFKF